MAIISVKNLCFTPNGIEILKNISVEINSGEVVAIVGASGSGKSTFLRCLNLLTMPTSGKIKIDNKDVFKDNINLIRSNMTMVFQNFNLFANLNVIENLTLAPIKMGFLSQDEITQKALTLLNKVGLANRSTDSIKALSGGERQRVAIIRALMMDPSIILFDEPTSALDPYMVGEILDLMASLAKTGLTMLIVTHEIAFARRVANRALFMSQGQILADAKPELMFDFARVDELKDPITREQIKHFLKRILH